MWGWLSLKSQRKDLTAFYLPKIDGKIVCVLRKASFFSGVHVPLAKCGYPQNQDGRMPVSMPVIPVNSLVHKVGFFYLPDGEVDQLKHTLPHCTMQLSVVSYSVTFYS